MFQPRPCGCKGIRTCLDCEAEFGVISKYNQISFANQKTLEYCYKCDKCWEGQSVSIAHPHHQGESYYVQGINLIPNFITEEEENELVSGCDSIPWDLSQSGRRKQNFGPRTNFKKRKLKIGSFSGFPSFSEFAQNRLSRTEGLEQFYTIEQCAIEYREEKGASIDPHIDDCWVWGERVLSLSLLSHSTLTLNKYTKGDSKYNLDYFNQKYNKSSKPEAKIVPNGEEIIDKNENYPVIRIPMPRYSLLVLTSEARYEWEHSILRSDISGRRICMAYREFTPEYLEDGENYENVGKDIIEAAKQFF